MSYWTYLVIGFFISDFGLLAGQEQL